MEGICTQSLCLVPSSLFSCGSLELTVLPSQPQALSASLLFSSSLVCFAWRAFPSACNMSNCAPCSAVKSLQAPVKTIQAWWVSFLTVQRFPTDAAFARGKLRRRFQLTKKRDECQCQGLGCSTASAQRTMQGSLHLGHFCGPCDGPSFMDAPCWWEGTSIGLQFNLSLGAGISQRYKPANDFVLQPP